VEDSWRRTTSFAEMEGGPFLTTKENQRETIRRRRGALEVVYFAASNDIKKGVGIAITVEPPSSGETAIGAKS
jgi:hypothetical protein